MITTVAIHDERTPRGVFLEMSLSWGRLMKMLSSPGVGGDGAERSSACLLRFLGGGRIWLDGWGGARGGAGGAGGGCGAWSAWSAWSAWPT